jgi:intracellular sulfur oxidation DsrE/DsrF family protein
MHNPVFGLYWGGSVLKKMMISLCAAAALSAAAGAAPIAPASTGPVITDFGPHYPVAAPGFETATDIDYRVVFDVARSDQDTDAVNPSIATAARFLNMHAASGVEPARMHIAVVVHGAAAGDILNDGAYEKRAGIANPNTALLDQLAEAGVEIIVCGQTAAHRGFGAGEFNSHVTIALSAMTALTILQYRGYALIQF